MNQQLSPLPVSAPRRSRPWAFAAVAIVVVLVGGAVLVLREMIHAPAKVVEQAGSLIKESGRQLRSVAEAFHQGTVRTEFLSHAAEVTGASRFQFATLTQTEIFKREEAGAMAWGWVPLPRVVVQAHAPVEYSYSIDLAAPWQLEREGDTLRMLAPPIEPNTPALDVSALTFYTLEGSIWRDEAAVREKLRQSLTASLKERAVDNEKLVREIGRKRLEEFVEKWLAVRFSDGQNTHVKVVFPDEQRVTAAENNHL